MSRPERLFVGGLPLHVEPEDVERLLSRFGAVSEISLSDPASRPAAAGRFAHVTLEAAPGTVERCLGAFNQTRWKGGILRVARARAASPWDPRRRDNAATAAQCLQADRTERERERRSAKLSAWVRLRRAKNAPRVSLGFTVSPVGFERRSAALDGTTDAFSVSQMWAESGDSMAGSGSVSLGDSGDLASGSDLVLDGGSGGPEAAVAVCKEAAASPCEKADSESASSSADESMTSDSTANLESESSTVETDLEDATDYSESDSHVDLEEPPLETVGGLESPTTASSDDAESAESSDESSSDAEPLENKPGNDPNEKQPVASVGTNLRQLVFGPQTHSELAAGPGNSGEALPAQFRLLKPEAEDDSPSALEPAEFAESTGNTAVEPISRPSQRARHCEVGLFELETLAEIRALATERVLVVPEDHALLSYSQLGDAAAETPHRRRKRGRGELGELEPESEGEDRKRHKPRRPARTPFSADAELCTVTRDLFGGLWAANWRIWHREWRSKHRTACQRQQRRQNRQKTG